VRGSTNGLSGRFRELHLLASVDVASGVSRRGKPHHGPSRTSQIHDRARRPGCHRMPVPSWRPRAGGDPTECRSGSRMLALVWTTTRGPRPVSCARTPSCGSSTKSVTTARS